MYQKRIWTLGIFPNSPITHNHSIPSVHLIPMYQKRIRTLGIIPNSPITQSQVSITSQCTKREYGHLGLSRIVPSLITFKFQVSIPSQCTKKGYGHLGLSRIVPLLITTQSKVSITSQCTTEERMWTLGIVPLLITTQSKVSILSQCTKGGYQHLGLSRIVPLLNPKCPSHPNVPRENMDTWDYPVTYNHSIPSVHPIPMYQERILTLGIIPNSPIAILKTAKCISFRYSAY